MSDAGVSIPDIKKAFRGPRRAKSELNGCGEHDWYFDTA